MSIASLVRFSELSGLLERISKSKKLSEKQSLLSSFISKWREYSKNFKGVSVSENSHSFYAAMRLIMPLMDKSRPAYGIKETTLAKLYCDVLCLGVNSPDAKKLIGYKSPKIFENKYLDFAEIAYDVLKNRSPSKGSITIEEVNMRLDKIAEANGQSKKEIINENLIFLCQNTNALDQKWLIRIILKDLSLGLSAKTIFKCYHPLSENFYNVTNDLESVCDKFRSFDDKVELFSIQLFKPFKPMLSNRGNIQNILQQTDNKSFIHEVKFDGERVQLHKHGSHYRYWSRNCLEWTNSYGANPISGTLTPFIHSQFKVTVENCILDGEMMGFNTVTKTMGSKTEEFDIKRPNVEKLSGYLPCFVVFDVVYLNNEVLTERSLIERKTILDKDILESELEGKIKIAKWKEASTREECLSAFNVAIENCEEGLMVKRIDSIYKVNSRVSGWFKIKPDYVLGLHEELDCVIVGGYFSGGSMIGHFLCAVKSDQDKYYSFAKVGSGFTRKILYEFNVKIAQHWKIYHKENPPSWLVLAGKSREIPDIYIEPEKSFVVQLKAAEIISSENYATCCTLRFARIDCFREDKSPIYDCMTLEELNKLRSTHKGKLALHSLEINSDDDQFSELEVEKRSKKRAFKRLEIAEHFKSTVPNKKIQNSSEPNSIFNGKEFCIMITNVCNKNYDKKQLESFIFNNGGEVVQNPSKSTFAVVINKVTVKVQNLMKANQYDIVSADWLMECINKNCFAPLKPLDYFCMKRSTTLHLKTLFDAAGDSYSGELSVEQMKVILEDMEKKSIKVPTLSPDDKSAFIDEMMIGDLESTYLNGCVIHFYIPQHIDYNIVKLSEVNRLKCTVSLAGACITDDLDHPTLSHIVLTDVDSESDSHRLHLLNRERERKFYLVSMRWVLDSINAGTRINEHRYFCF